jgi:uncharacterized OB-fold protein
MSPSAADEVLPGGPQVFLPLVDETTAFFWHSGRDGRLRFLRCGDCGWYLHPPGPVCPRCHSRALAASVVSGRGTVHSYTLNHQQWYPGQRVPYVIAIVDLPEQEELRLTTNIVGCPSERLRIGMPVRVTFAERGGVHLPLFEPEES